MALALGLDAFSVSLTIGLFHIRLRKVLFVSSLIGFFHMVFPLIGMIIGHFLSIKLPFITSAAGGFLLTFIGIYIIISTFNSQVEKQIKITNVKLMTLSFVVSIDSLPVGISLGVVHMEKFFIILMFGICSMLLAIFGMMIGRKAHGWLRSSSTIIGGAMLMLIGVYIMFYESLL